MYVFRFDNIRVYNACCCLIMKAKAVTWGALNNEATARARELLP